MLARHCCTLVLSAALIACAAEPGGESFVSEAEPLAQLRGPATRLVVLVSTNDGVTRPSPVILSAPVVSETPAWSTAFRLVCNDCTRALDAFGYSAQDALFATQYQDEGRLRADNQLAPEIPLVDLPLEASSSEPAVLTAFRVVDASEPADPRYLVRLRIAPETLYTTTCENFLRVAQGSLETVPINKRLLAHWALPKILPTIGCSTISGKELPAPQPAPFATPPASARTTIEAVWTVARAGAIPGSSANPYVVTKDGTGKRRGFVVDCGSDARAALLSLGVKFEDVVITPASEKQLADTDFGKQPVLRCGGIASNEILEITSANDTTKTKRFRFQGQRDLVEFGCREAEAYWSERKTGALDDVPYQALGYLDAFEGSGEATRIFHVGCRVVDPCIANPSLAQCNPCNANPNLPQCNPCNANPNLPQCNPCNANPNLPQCNPCNANPNLPQCNPCNANPNLPQCKPQRPATWPPPTSPLRPGTGCVYVQWCDLPNHAAGAVCRTYAGCAINANTITECRNDTRTTCGTPKTPFWFCDEASNNCRQL